METKSQIASVLKFIIGSLTAASLSAFLTWHYQTTQLEYQKIEQERIFFKSMLEVCVDSNLERRHKVSKYFACMLGGKWQDYYLSLELELQETKKQLNTLKATTEVHVLPASETTFIDRLAVEVPNKMVNDVTEEILFKESDLKHDKVNVIRNEIEMLQDQIRPVYKKFD